MTTPVQEVISLDELADMLEDNAPCMYRHVNSKTGAVRKKCDKSAEWAGTCRRCGTISLLCDEHHNRLTAPPGSALKMWCSICKLRGTTLSEIYLWVHRI